MNMFYRAVAGVMGNILWGNENVYMEKLRGMLELVALSWGAELHCHK